MTTQTIATTTIDDATIIATATEYRQLRDRVTNPTGTFDKSGRFYLADRGDCCRGIRCPSRAFPYSEMVHGRTALHVATLAGVDVRLVKREAKRQDAA